MTVSPKLKALFDEDVTPVELFQSFVREIGRYARVPERAKTGIRHGKRANGRLLSYKEIGEIEDKMIKEGSGLKPRYFKGGRDMRGSRKNMEERMGKLYEVIKEQVGIHKYFKTRMLTDSVLLRARITDSQSYFNRTMHEDLRRLVQQVLIYRRGRGASSTYYLGDNREEPYKGETSEDHQKRGTRAMSYDCLGIAHSEMDECEECEAYKHCHDVQKRLQEANRMEKDQYEAQKEPLIPRHVTVDINVTFRLGTR